MGISVKHGSQKDPDIATMPHSHPSKPFGMPVTPFDPKTGKYLGLNNDGDSHSSLRHLDHQADHEWAVTIDGTRDIDFAVDSREYISIQNTGGSSSWGGLVVGDGTTPGGSVHNKCISILKSFSNVESLEATVSGFASIYTGTWDYSIYLNNHDCQAHLSDGFDGSASRYGYKSSINFASLGTSSVQTGTCANFYASALVGHSGTMSLGTNIFNCIGIYNSMGLGSGVTLVNGDLIGIYSNTVSQGVLTNGDAMQIKVYSDADVTAGNVYGIFSDNRGSPANNDIFGAYFINYATAPNGVRYGMYLTGYDVSQFDHPVEMSTLHLAAATNKLIIGTTETLTTDETLDINLADASRSLTVSGDSIIDQDLSTTGDVIHNSINAKMLSTDIIKTGWPLVPGVTLSFDNGSRTLTVTDGGSAVYYINGTSYTLGGNKTVTINDTEGTWFIYFSGSTLTASQTPWVITDDDKALVAYVLWDATNKKEIFLGYECHGYTMDAATHARLHDGGGAAWETGLAVTDAGGELLNVSTGDFWDEDLQTTITDGAGSALFEQVLTPLESPIYYLSGASNWRIYETTDKANATDAGYVTGGDLHYNKLNGTWASAAAGVGKYVAMFILGTNDTTEPVITVMGQRIDTTLANAKLNNTFPGMVMGTAPYQEVVVLARVILKATSGGLGYTLEHVLDLRSANAEGNVTSPLITQHDGLGNLNWDDAGHVFDVDLTLPDGIGLNLQEDITFTGATTENLIKVPDNLADALSFKDASANVYQQFISTTGGLAVDFPQEIRIQSDKFIIAKGTLTSDINTAMGLLGADGGEVYIPEGVWTYDAQILPLQNNITLRGAGPSTIINASAGQPAHIIYINGKTNVIIRDMHVLGKDGGGQATSLIYYDSNSDFGKVLNCRLEDGDDNILTINNADFCEVDGCDAINADNIGIYYAGSSAYGGTSNCSCDNNAQGIVVRGNFHTVMNCRTDNSTYYGINLWSTSGTSVTNCVCNNSGWAGIYSNGTLSTISCCTFWTNTQDAIRVNASYTTIVGCGIYGSTRNGVSIISGTGHTVADCFFDGNGNGYSDITFNGVSYSKIANVVCRGSAGKAERGVYLVNSDNNVITGVTSYTHDTEGITLDGNSDNNHVHGNHLEDEAVSDLSDAGSNNTVTKANAGTLDYSAVTVDFANTGLHILDTGGNFDLILKYNEAAGQDNTLSLVLGDASRSLTLLNDMVLGTTNGGTLDYSAASKTLTVEDDSLIDQDLTADSTAAQLATLNITTLLNLTAGQIAFPATQVPSADPNTFDDCEKGNCTPGIAFGGGTTGIAYSLQTGRYVKHGNQITVTGHVTLSNKGSDNGDVTITGLPDTIENVANVFPVAKIWMHKVSFANQFEAIGLINTTMIGMYEVTEAGVLSTITDANFANDSDVDFTITYRV